MTRVRLGAICAMAISTSLLAQRAGGVAPQEAMAFTHASVVNVRTGEARRDATVVIRGGRIESVGSGTAPAGVRVVDLGGRYLVPGLIDAHVHIASLPQMRAALESGVTTARSAGAAHFADVGLRDLARQGAVAGPDLLAAGYHLRTFPAPELFVDQPDLADLMSGLTTLDALRRVVRANLAHGVDWIKVNATERAGTPDTDPRKQMFSGEELSAIVREAATRGAPVLAHAHGAEGALAAVRAGVRSIEHGTYLTDETLKLMAARDVYFVPTADIVDDLAGPGGDYDHPALIRRGQMMQPVLKAAIGRAVALGVKVAAGSDTGYGPTSISRLSREAVKLVECGLTPLQALQAATLVNAEMLKLETRIGLVEAGFEADLLVVDANPASDIRALLDPLLVVSNGRVGLDRLSFAK